MSITFAGTAIVGTHGALEEEPPELRAREVAYHGLHGVFAQISGRGARTLSVRMTLHNRYPSQSMLDAIVHGLNIFVGYTGELAVTHPSGGSRSLGNCIFIGFQPDNAPDNRAGPLKDDAGTLDGGWWIQGMLMFRQLSVER